MQYNFDKAEYGALFESLLKELFPICRSITGNGVRESLKILSEVIPLKIKEVPSGTQVYDWVVPEEWNIKDAWLKDAKGQKICDFKTNNVCVVSYSTPVSGKFTFAELKPHLHSLPQLPNALPYRTSYYKKNWGFCLPHSVLEKMDPNASYEVFIDSSHNPQGKLTYGEALHKGAEPTEIFLSTYCCHPSLANDNLSGLITATLLFKYLSMQKTRYSYRLAIVPETIGAIVYLQQNEAAMKKLLGGLVITTTGGRGPLGLKPSFAGNHEVDRAARQVLNESGEKWVEYPFVPDGSDERQYCSPGFRIPTVSLTKDKYYEYKEYHTSADNLEFVTVENLLMTFSAHVNWFKTMEANRVYMRPEPHCEFQLGKRGLYPNTGGAYNQTVASSTKDEITAVDLEAMSWLMFGADGKTSLLELAERSKIPVPTFYNSAERMVNKGLLKEVMHST